MGRQVVYRSLSFYDLERAGFKISVTKSTDDSEIYQIRSVSKGGTNINLRDFYKALYTLGIKNNHHLHVEPETEHVTLEGKRYSGHRVSGEERSDGEWIKSGFASEEAYLSNSKYSDMVQHGMRMQRGG